jgi:hypothetical protein
MSDLIERLCSWPPSLATVGEAADRIDALEKHKRLQMEDIMNLGAQLGQAWLRIEQLEDALRLTRPYIEMHTLSPNGTMATILAKIDAACSDDGLSKDVGCGKSVIEPWNDESSPPKASD